MASHRRTFSVTKVHSLFLVLLVSLLATSSNINQAEAAPSGVSRTLYELPKMATSTIHVSIGRKNISVERHLPAHEQDPPAPAQGPPAPAQGRRIVWSQNIDISALEPGRRNIIWSRLEFSAQDTVLRLPAAPANGAPANGAPANGAPANGAPANGAPANGAPANGAPANGAPANGAPDNHPWGENLPGDILKITNEADQSVQYFNAVTLRQWSFKSAFFNGGRLRLELHADQALPVGENPSVVVTVVKVNSASSDGTDTIRLAPPNAQCNANDGRRPSVDTKIARILPIGCTSWTINDPSNSGCQLTAGHCFDGHDITEQVLQFNVPRNIVIRTQGGDQVAIYRHPPADQQFAIDVASVQFRLHSAFRRIDSEDWGYFGVHPNPNTGLRPREQFGNQAFDLAPVNPETGLLNEGTVNVGDQATIRGFGAVYAAARLELNQVQQSHTGTVQRLGDAYHVNHRADTEGGNSGSPIILANGQALGIHTNGGCRIASPNSSNWGSTVAMRGLRAALAAPRGVCRV